MTDQATNTQDASGSPLERRVRRHARLWRDSEGLLEEVQEKGRVVRVVRRDGYARQNSVACELTDTGNGFIVRFLAHSSCDQDKYICMDYDEARNLVLALTPHAKELGFAA